MRIKSFLFAFSICAFSLSCASIRPDGEAQEYQLLHKVIIQPVDHADPIGPKLEQHVDILIPKDAPLDAPVFFNLGNEHDLAQEELVELYQHHGRRNDLIYVQAEHRGYGQSLTEDEDQSVPLYLSKDQALADTHEVIRQLKENYSGPWMAAGWSYGGALVIDFASHYPEDVAVILSSSGVVDWPFMNYSYDRRIRATLGERCYNRMAKHMRNLKSDEPFDEAWLEQEFLTALVVGTVQYQEFNKLQPSFSLLSYLPTRAFLGVSHWFDNVFAGGKARDFALASGAKSVHREEVASGRYTWHAWRYQQCSETGVFFASEDSDGLFDRTRDDFCRECEALFGAVPYTHTPEWSLREKVKHLRVPLIYVSGGRDPWYAIGLDANYPLAHGKNIHVPDGFHCPDRDDEELARRILEEMLLFAAP